ncbi:MAG: glycosyltransferase [Patescibacteria group bacterium]|mgnify:CR=1 FL=1
MKIIYVENVRVPSERAHAYQISQTCAWFARLGHDVTLVNPDRAGGKDIFTEYGLEPGLLKHVTLRIIDPLSWDWFPLKKIAYALQRYFFVRKLRSWARIQTADIWYTRDPAMIDALKDVQVARWALELHDAPDANSARWDRIKGSIAVYIAISRGLVDWLKKKGIDAALAPDGFDPKEIESLKTREEARKILGLPEDAFIAIYTGTFYPWKGVDLVARAWAKTPSSVHLVLIGGPESDLKRIEQCIDPMVSSRVHLFSMMPRRDAISILSAADIGLLTTSPNYAIGREFTSPLKQFEYLAACLPLLATEVPSSHEVLDNDVAKFFNYTEDDFAVKIIEIINDSSWREAAASFAKNRASEYTWEARSKRILDVLQI